MRIAEILSDLTSLRVCDHEAALALVNARPSKTDTAQTGTTTGSHAEEGEEEDPDLKRAKDLIDLHYAVKVKRQQGDDLGLGEARERVRVAMLGVGVRR